MTPADRLRRIHDVTDNFFFWQGLRWIPMGAALLGLAVASSPRVPMSSALREWIALPLFGVAIWLSSSVLGRYYARHFGRVRGDPSRHTRRTSVKWLVVYPAIAAAFVIDAKFGPPVIVSALAFAIAIEAYRQSTGGGRVHYTVAALGLVAFAILPLFGVVSTGKQILTPLIGVVGLIYIVGGLLDHRELVRMFAPVPEEAHVSPV
jgi:type IV secretory pathway TrbD component